MATIPISPVAEASAVGEPLAGPSAAHTLAELRDRVRRLERRGRRNAPFPDDTFPDSTADPWRLSTGWPQLDRLLPAGGLERGTLCEWLSGGLGSGAAWLALRAAAMAALAGGVVVVIDLQRQFYPPAAVDAGLDLARTLLVHPDDAHDAAWTFDQALRCPGVAAVFGSVDELDDRTFRRWQLAAETGGALGALVRPVAARRLPSWAECRFWVEPLGFAPPCLAVSGQPPGGMGARPPGSMGARPPNGLALHDGLAIRDGRCRRWRVELLRGRGTQAGRAATVELGGVFEPHGARECSPQRPTTIRNLAHETPALHLASQLAVATSARRAARA